MKPRIDRLLRYLENTLFVVIYCMLFLRLGNMIGQWLFSKF